MGSVLAIAQPGNLGDEDTTQAPTSTTTTTLISPTTTLPSVTTTVVVTSTLPSEEPTTTIAGSGLGTPGAPSGGDDGTATTGGESWLGVGLALAAIGLVMRRTAQTRSA